MGRAFSERAILKTFMDAESTLPAGSLKVNHIIACYKVVLEVIEPVMALDQG